MGHNHDHHYHFVPGEAGDAARFQAAKRVTIVGAVVNALLSLAKVVVGYIGQSQALIADGVHSLSDLVTDAMVLFAAKHSSREADESHPYGHARIETAVTVALGAVLILVGLGISVDAMQRLFHPEQLLAPGAVALVAAVISVLAKEGLYRYTLVVARRIRSNLLRANAWHHRTDAASSVVVIFGVVATMAGLPYFDAIAAIGVALMIAKVGWDLAWHSVRELVDTGLEADRIEAIERVIVNVDGVRAMHMLRTRRMGQDALVDVHILVDPRLSVSEGHHISETVRTRVIQEIDEVQDVLVHIDPEDDETAAPSIDLPSRQQILAALRPHWEKIISTDQIRQVMLHYLDGKVAVELILPMSAVGDHAEADAIVRGLARSAEAMEEVSGVRVYFT